MQWVEWSIWLLVAIIALYFWAQMIADWVTGDVIRIADAARALMLTLLCNWFLVISDWSKLHLIWLSIIVGMVGVPISAWSTAAVKQGLSRLLSVLRERWLALEHRCLGRARRIDRPAFQGDPDLRSQRADWSR